MGGGARPLCPPPPVSAPAAGYLECARSEVVRLVVSTLVPSGWGWTKVSGVAAAATRLRKGAGLKEISRSSSSSSASTDSLEIITQ